MVKYLVTVTELIDGLPEIFFMAVVTTPETAVYSFTRAVQMFLAMHGSGYTAQVVKIQTTTLLQELTEQQVFDELPKIFA